MNKGALQRDRLIFISLVDILLQLVFVLLILIFVIFNDNVKTARFGSVLDGVRKENATCQRGLSQCQAMVATFGIDRKPCIEIDGNNGQKTSIVLATFGIFDDGITLVRLADAAAESDKSKIINIYGQGGIKDPTSQKLSYDKFRELFGNVSSECRYYASVSDKTSSNNKAGWQRGIGAVYAKDGFSQLRQ